MRDLVFVSLEPWNAIWRRNQFLCAQLATRFPSMRLLFVERPLFAPTIWKSGHRPPTFARRLRRVEGFSNIRAFAPLKPLPNPVPGGRAWNERSMRLQIARASRLAGLRDPLLWLNPFDFGFVRGHLKSRGVVYDITDDWELAARDDRERERIRGLDRALCESADLTVVCSSALFESRAEVAKRLLHLPNGVDAAHYAGLKARDARASGHFALDGTFCPDAAPAAANHQENSDGLSPAQGGASQGGASRAEPGAFDTSSWPRPVFGYTGSLHPERIDLELVKTLARAFPKGSVVLVGPNFFGGDRLARELRDFPNVALPGAVAYASIPDVMAGFDVCIVPHQRNEFVESLNPIKLWEFLAAGKPIVSADVAGFRDFSGLVRLASDPPAFVQACRDALQEVNACAGLVSPVPCQLAPRQREAVGHSWQVRTEELLRALSEAGLVESASSSVGATP